ncbi:hypothetical protein ES703_15063 [subsurface metagenome]
MTLVENADFSQFPAEITSPSDVWPRFWEGWTDAGSAMEIKQSLSVYHSAPSALLFSGSSSCPACTVGIKQSIPIKDNLQTSGIYRLMFYYKSSQSNIFICPQINFYGDETSGVTFPLKAITTTSDAWKLYDEQVEIDLDDNTVTRMELVIMIARTAIGAFDFYMDDVDFHYAFNLAKPPGFPSATPPTLAPVFSRTSDRGGHLILVGEGNVKHRGAFNFYLISEAQMKKLKAAWTFMKGHRLNVSTVWPHRVDVNLPSSLAFQWPDKVFNFEPATMAEHLFTGKVTVEGI